MKFKMLFIIFMIFIGGYAINTFITTNPLPTDCVFCNQEFFVDRAFYEDELVIALLTHKPYHPGHSLVIPRRHVERFEELTDAELNRIMKIIKNVHGTISSTYGNSSYIIWQKNGREALGSVPHLHFHYIPRPHGHYSPLFFFLRVLWTTFINKPLSRLFLKEETQHLRSVMNPTLISLQ